MLFGTRRSVSTVEIRRHCPCGPSRNTIRFVFWERAPDQRMLRTLDWMNDECEAAIKKRERRDGTITYRAIMSPVQVRVTRPRGRALTARWPITVLVTDEWLLVATKKWGRRAKIHKLPVGSGYDTLQLFFRSTDEKEFIESSLPGISVQHLPRG
jgi:hypothetical protein